MAKRKPGKIRVGATLDGIPAVTLFPPGARSGGRNRTWFARGTVDGVGREISTAVTDPKGQAEAHAEWAGYVRSLRVEGAALRPGRPETVADLMALMVEIKKPRKTQEAYYRKLERDPTLGPVRIDDVTSHDLHAAARRLYPKCKGQTLNRNALSPWSTAFRYAAEQKWCAPLKIERFDEEAVPLRRPEPGTPQRLVKAADDLGKRDERDWLVFDFHQGWRVTETLRPSPKDIDWTKHTIRVFVSKARKGKRVGVWKEIPLHPVVVEMFKRRKADGLMEGERIWPWKDRHQLYDAMDPVLLKAGLAKVVGHKTVKGGKNRSRRQRKPVIVRYYTPHMARHEWGSQAAENRLSSYDMVDGNTWTNEKSPAIYRQISDESRQRIASAISFDLDGDSGKETGKEKASA